MKYSEKNLWPKNTLKLKIIKDDPTADKKDYEEVYIIDESDIKLLIVICQDICAVCQIICHAAKRFQQTGSASQNGVTSFSWFAMIFIVFLALFFGVMPIYATEVPCYLAENEASPAAASGN